MPAPATIDELLDLSQKSGILDKKGLDDYLQKVRSGPGVPAAPQDLAEAMVRDGLLTRFQADQLLQGKWRNFVISGKFKLLERLGEGGMGTVFLCEHMRLKRRVALKVLPATQSVHSSVVERFEREARAVAALDHPNIIKIHDVDRDGKLHYLVMEYVEGSSLQDIIKKKGPLDALRACHYIFQACLGLQHAHDKGLVHRDIKPGNILLDRSGAVKILDLGLARFFHDQGDNLTREHAPTAILGTADYLAPEQALDSHGVDARADIYSLGMTFYFLLAGKAPFAQGTLNQKLIWHQIRNPESITDLREDIPPELAAVLNRMIEKDPNMRFQSPAEVAEALAFWVQGPIDPPPPDEMPELSRAASGGPGSSPSTPAPGSSGGLNRRPTLPTAPKTPPLRPTAIQSTRSRAGNESALGDAGGFDRTDVLETGRKRRIDWETVLPWARLAGYALVVLVCLGGITWWALSRSGTTKVISDDDDEPSGPRGGGPLKKPPPRLNLRLAGEISTFRGHTGPVERVVFARDGTRAVSCSHDRTLRLWEVATGTTEHVLSGHTEAVHDAAFSPDGRFVLSGSFDTTERLWDTTTGNLVRTYSVHSSSVRAV